MLKRFRSFDIENSVVDRFIYFAYSEFTDEYSTIKLLYRKGKFEIIKAHFDFLRYRAKTVPRKLWMQIMLEYYPYLYSYRRLGKDSRIEMELRNECKKIYNELSSIAKKKGMKPLPELLGKMESLFDTIGLKKEHTCHKVDWSRGLNQDIENILKKQLV